MNFFSNVLQCSAKGALEVVVKLCALALIANIKAIIAVDFYLTDIIAVIGADFNCANFKEFLIGFKCDGVNFEINKIIL